MLNNIVISIYRILVCLVIALPIIINYLLKGSMVMSLITIPSVCLLLTIIAIYGDKKIGDSLRAIEQSLEPNADHRSDNIKKGSPSTSSKASVSSLY